MTDVLHLITRLDPGGSAENTVSTCRHLARRGWSVRLAAGPGLRPETARIEDDRTGVADDANGVPVVEVPALCRDPHPPSDLRAFAQIFRLLRRERPTILHTHSSKAGILGRWAAHLADVPHVVHTPHGHVLYGYHDRWKTWLYNLAEKMTAPLTDRLVALSRGELRESVEYGIGRPEQWVVIHSGVALDSVGPGPAGPTRVRRARERPGDDPPPGMEAGRRPLILGSVARLEPVKGIDLLVEAAALLVEEPGMPAFRIEVWGEGAERRELERRIQRHGLQDDFVLLGCPGTVASFLRRLDVYVQPSRNEGMGRALVLAQAASLPVVATRVCGIPDLVHDGATGLLAEPEEPAELGRALGRLLRDHDLRWRLAHHAPLWVRGVDETGHPRFSVEAMVHRIECLYRELTS